MQYDVFKKLGGDFLARMQDLLDKKGADYTCGDEDRLANFKRLAERTGVTPMQVWWVFVQKHLAAIENYVKSGKVESEPIHGRLQDVANYCLLASALIEDLAETRKE